MIEILKLNSISDKIYTVLDGSYTVSDSAADPTAVLVRSAQMADYEIGSNLVAVGRAGAGVNNIPLDKMAEKGVCVFNTPGANANAVKELVIAALLLASRDIAAGINWAATLTDGETTVQKQVEKGKSEFGGFEISGKTLGVVGLGAIGVLVANAANALGMKVVGYDPMLSEKNKAKLNPEIAVTDMETVISSSDYLTLHLPYLPATKNMINAETIAAMKAGAAVINMARGELVDNTAIKAALENGKIRRYVVDFPSAETVNVKGIIAIPHLGASTEEAEDNCAVMAAAEIKDYIENGIITNSVNLPAYNKAKTGVRVTAIAPASAEAAIKAAVPAADVAVRGNFLYAVADGDESAAGKFARVDGVSKIRIIK